MYRFFSLVIWSSVLSITAPAWAGSQTDSDEARQRAMSPYEVCFAPGTPQWMIEQARLRSEAHKRLVFGSLGISLFTFDDGDRWSSTATDGGGLGQGDPMTLTWSVVPDGTSIFGYNGEPTANSDLRAFLNGIYGDEATWLALFQEVFDRWSELTGITYVYEPNDDGSAWTEFSISSGQIGVRGDVRIAGHAIDGNSGVLAYNFFPDAGDMVIDTNDSFYSDTSGNSLGLRNVFAHEHGHGIGLAHVCPISQTKLMEPFVSFAFDGPQHDDILAANRGYGDQHEHDDSVGSAASLGALTGTDAWSDLSIDDSSDIDIYSFSVGANQSIDVNLNPVGSSYLSGPQNDNGTCSEGTSFDSLNIHDLSVRVLATNGVTELASADANGAGLGEVLSDVALSDGAGTYYLEVNGDTTDAAQLYEIEILGDVSIFTDGFESGNTSAWSSTVS
jgi:hypothetical protein